jgi:hypothetical protein
MGGMGCGKGCFNEPVFENLWSDRIAVWQVDQSMWTHGCSYTLRLKSGTFQTVADPQKPVKAELWSFRYVASLPTLTSATKLRCDTCAATVLSIALRWDQKVKCVCRTDVGSLGQPEYIFSLEKLMLPDKDKDVTFVDLRPDTAYTVECRGSLAMDPSAQSDWLLAGQFATELDRNVELKELNAKVRPVCPGKDLDFVKVPKQGDRNQIVLTSADYYTLCESKAGTAALWDVQVEAITASRYANVTVTWSNDDGNESEPSGWASQPLGLLELDAYTPTASMDATIEVVQNGAGIRSVPIVLSILSVRLELDAHLTNKSLKQIEARYIESERMYNVMEADHLEVELIATNMDLRQIPDDLLKRLKIEIGPFGQATSVNLSTKSGNPTLIVSDVRGVGHSLQLHVLLDGITLCSTENKLTFPAPKVCRISTDRFRGCPSGRLLDAALDGASIGSNGCTTLFLDASPTRGFGRPEFSAQPSTLPEPLVQVRIARATADSNTTEECSDPKIYNSTSLTCTFCPKDPPPLALSIGVPTGNGSSMEAAPTGETVDLPYKEPTVLGVGPVDLPISEQVVLRVWGRDFPSFLDSRAWLELRRPSDAVMAGFDDTPGAIRLCNNLTLDRNLTNLSCLTQASLELGTLGCAEPTLAIGWPGGGVMPLAADRSLVRFAKPAINTVQAINSPFEVGENMAFELQGVGFGNRENGDFEVTVGNQKCEEISRNDTRIFCVVNGPLLDGIEAEYPRDRFDICDDTSRCGDATVVNITVTVPVRGAFGVGDILACGSRVGNNQTHKAELKHCPPGKRRKSVQSAKCVECVDGWYQPYTAPILNCAQCKEGTYSNLAAGFEQCSSCPAGHFTASNGAIACTPCPAGSQPASNHTECKLCGEGTYAPKLGMEVCLPCDAGRYAAEEGMTGCKACAPGTYEDSNTCLPCASGKFSSGYSHTSCSQCLPGKYTRDEGVSACSMCFWVGLHLTPPETDNRCSLEDTVMHEYFIAVVWCFACNFLSALLIIETFRRRVPVQDIRKQGKSTVILDTFGAHRLGTVTAHHKFRVTLKGTSTTHEGSIDGEYLAEIKTGESMLLFDLAGNDLKLPFVDTSIGVLAFPFPREFLYTYSLGKIPRIILIGALGSASLLVAIGYEIHSVLFVVKMIVSVLMAALTSFLHRCIWAKKSPIYNRISQYRGILRSENPYPQRCPRGPARAIQVNQVRELYGFFQAFIQDRNMYYLNENILLPITQKAKMSFAELAGPRDVDWFVSHYWGTRFKEFVESITAHAQGEVQEFVELCASPARSRVARRLNSGMDSSYWVCSLSNNQWSVTEEVGDGDWMESSFYKALQHETCKGTLMILDPQCLPFTRSWCLFEVLQTNLLQEKRRMQNLGSFQFLFGTHAGVINAGCTSADMVLRIVRKLKDVDLRTAQASHQQDKEMIDSLIIAEGGFDAMNAFVRSNIKDVLQVAKGHLEQEFDELHESLGRAQAESLARIPTMMIPRTLPTQSLYSASRHSSNSPTHSESIKEGDDGIGPRSAKTSSTTLLAQRSFANNSWGLDRYWSDVSFAESASDKASGLVTSPRSTSSPSASELKAVEVLQSYALRSRLHATSSKWDWCLDSPANASSTKSSTKGCSI